MIPKIQYSEETGLYIATYEATDNFGIGTSLAQALKNLEVQSFSIKTIARRKVLKELQSMNRDEYKVIKENE